MRSAAARNWWCSRRSKIAAPTISASTTSWRWASSSALDRSTSSPSTVSCQRAFGVAHERHVERGVDPSLGVVGLTQRGLQHGDRLHPPELPLQPSELMADVCPLRAALRWLRQRPLQVAHRGPRRGALQSLRGGGDQDPDVLGFALRGRAEDVRGDLIDRRPSRPQPRGCGGVAAAALEPAELLVHRRPHEWVNERQQVAGGQDLGDDEPVGGGSGRANGRSATAAASSSRAPVANNAAARASATASAETRWTRSSTDRPTDDGAIASRSAWGGAAASIRLSSSSSSGLPPVTRCTSSLGRSWIIRPTASGLRGCGRIISANSPRAAVSPCLTPGSCGRAVARSRIGRPSSRARQMGDEPAGFLVEPVQVVDREHERRTLRQIRHQGRRDRRADPRFGRHCRRSREAEYGPGECGGPGEHRLARCL